MRIYSMKVNHCTNPLGFRMTRTVFSWKVGEAKGKAQVAARVCVALDEGMTETIFDSGFDEKADSLGYRAEFPLQPYTRYYWTVTIRTDAGEEETGKTQWFETAKREDAWEGRWITCDSTQMRHPVFEKEIQLRGPVRQARLYICGLGLYEAYYNGQRIGDEYLTPYSNDYNEWLQYQTFDVTKYVAGHQGAEQKAGQKSAEKADQETVEEVGQETAEKAGQKTAEKAGWMMNSSCGRLSVLLGNGWYKGRFGFSTREGQGFFGQEWMLIAELRLTYEDGSTEVIGTDESWRVRRSRITYSSLYDGEHRDDTLEELPAENVALCAGPAGALTERMSLPVTVHEEFTPVALLHTPAGEEVFDMGQEFTGIFSLRVEEPAGTVIHIQTGEVLQDGNFYNANLRSAKSEYFYISDGRAKTIVPHFTFYGYRYVKVEGVRHLQKEDFRGLALYSDLEFTGQMETGHALVNRLIQNVQWGQKGNFLDVPTDCPQRDERMGWTGDAQVFAPTALYLSDSYAFYAKFLYDLEREQRVLGGLVPQVVPSCGMEGTSSAWGDAACIIPWNLYLFYGDKSILEDQFESMKGWVDYIRRVDGDHHGWRHVFHYGDWLALDNPAGGVEQTFGGTDVGFIANVYYAVSAGLVAKAAGVLEKSAEEAQYRALCEEQFAEVKKEYYSVTGRCCIRTQTALLLTLKYHLSENVELTKSQLETLFRESGGKLKTGFVGTPILNNVLTENGFSKLAYDLLLNEEYPGWLHEVKLGATTVWERWNSLLDDGTISGIGMNSLNHYAYGSVLEWMFRYVAGIHTVDTAPGLREVSFAPVLSYRLGEMTASYDSPAGLYESHWKMTDPSHVTLSVTVPFGCRASLRLPEAVPETYEDAENPMFAHREGEVCLLEPGTYTVTYQTREVLA